VGRKGFGVGMDVFMLLGAPTYLYKGSHFLGTRANGFLGKVKTGLVSSYAKSTFEMIWGVLWFYAFILQNTSGNKYLLAVTGHSESKNGVIFTIGHVGKELCDVKFT
jgi:hypothetical protein